MLVLWRNVREDDSRRDLGANPAQRRFSEMLLAEVGKPQEP